MDFVTFKIAKKLKGLGFNKPFFFFYREDDEDKKVHHVFLSKPLIYCNAIDDEVIIAPTIEQVLKWLREEKKIHIQILFACPPSKWEYIIVEMTNNELRETYTSFKSYEQAALAGIEDVLNDLI